MQERVTADPSLVIYEQLGPSSHPTSAWSAGQLPPVRTTAQWSLSMLQPCVRFLLPETCIAPGVGGGWEPAPGVWLEGHCQSRSEHHHSRSHSFPLGCGAQQDIGRLHHLGPSHHIMS